MQYDRVLTILVYNSNIILFSKSFLIKKKQITAIKNLVMSVIPSNKLYTKMLLLRIANLINTNFLLIDICIIKINTVYYFYKIWRLKISADAEYNTTTTLAHVLILQKKKTKQCKVNDKHFLPQNTQRCLKC